jgi:hypothetical protein
MVPPRRATRGRARDERRTERHLGQWQDDRCRRPCWASRGESSERDPKFGFLAACIGRSISTGRVPSPFEAWATVPPRLATRDAQSRATNERDLGQWQDDRCHPTLLGIARGEFGAQPNLGFLAACIWRAVSTGRVPPRRSLGHGPRRLARRGTRDRERRRSGTLATGRTRAPPDPAGHHDRKVRRAGWTSWAPGADPWSGQRTSCAD